VKEKARRIARRETLGSYGRRWIMERRNSHGEPLRPLTREDYEQVLAKYINPTLGRMHVDEITRSDVRRWYAGLAEPAPRARTKAYGLLRSIMNSAVDDELITISPVHIRGAGATTKRKVLEPAAPAELKLITANMPERLRAAVMISTWCALRYGELAELRRKDIDTEQKPIKVRRAVTFRPGGAVVGPPKSEAGVRDVAIPPHVWPIIEEHLNTHVKPAPNAMLSLARPAATSGMQA
jgi:integrase